LSHPKQNTNNANLRSEDLAVVENEVMFVGYVTGSSVVDTSAGHRAQEDQEAESGGTFY
jgi:hypothetical protein